MNPTLNETIASIAKELEYLQRLNPISGGALDAAIKDLDSCLKNLFKYIGGKQ